MGESSSALELAAKIRRTADGLGVIQRSTVDAVAKTVQATILARAAGAKPGPHSSWVQVQKVADGTDPIRALQLRGGFAYLAEKGSYKKPGGWEEKPRGMSRSRRGRLRRQQGLRGRAAGPFDVSSVAGVLGNKATGFAAAYVHHPGKPAHPFWHEGIAASERAATGIWLKAAQTTLARLW